VLRNKLKAHDQKEEEEEEDESTLYYSLHKCVLYIEM